MGKEENSRRSVGEQMRYNYFMKKLLILLALVTTSMALGQTSSSVLTGSAQPPLPYNIIAQPGFENRSTGWSVTGGVFTTVNDFAHLARGLWSAKWTPPASTTAGVCLQSDAVTLPAGLYGRQCGVQMLYLGNASTVGTISVSAYDGTTSYGATNLLDVTTYTQIQSAAFTCPSTGTLRIRICNTATTPASPTALYFDEAIIADISALNYGAGINTLGPIGSVPNGNAGSIVASTLTLQPASASFGGVLTAGTQTLAGAKTFALAPTITGLTTGAVINTSGLLSSEAQLAVARGGTGIASGTSGGILGFTGATTLASSGLLTNHALLVGGGAGATPTAVGSLGSTTTLLHGNASGDPTFSAVSLTADVSGTLPIASGGTGQTSASAAITALSPQSTKGDLLAYSSLPARLPVGSDNQVLIADSSQTVGLRWVTQGTGTGNVIGPVSSTDKAIARWNGTGGTTIQDSGITISDTSVVDGALLKDSTSLFVDDGDNTKKLAFQVSGVATGTTRTVTMPNANVDLGNLTNSNISASAAIAYSKLASMSTGQALIGNAGTPTATTLSGDVTVGATGVTAIGANKVANSQLATMATAQFKGRTTAGTGNVEDLTATQATALLDAMVGDSGSGGTKGLVPAPASGDASTKFLKANGTWAVPAGAGSVTSVGLSVPASSLFSVSGSPVTTSGTLAIATAGTSGGVPYFDSTSTLNSSALLTNHAIVLGGGAGAAPKVVASLGTTTTLLHGAAAGDPTFSAVALASDVSGTLPVANGGTNQTTYTDGQLLIGNTSGNTLTKATISAGTGIAVTNGNGSITLAANVTSSGTTERTERATLSLSGTSNPTISSQSGSWLSSCVRNSTGNYTCTIAGSIFSAATFVCNFLTAGTTNVLFRMDTLSTTSFRLLTANVTPAQIDLTDTLYIHCQGPR